MGGVVRAVRPDQSRHPFDDPVAFFFPCVLPHILHLPWKEEAVLIKAPKRSVLRLSLWWSSHTSPSLYLVLLCWQQYAPCSVEYEFSEVRWPRSSTCERRRQFLGGSKSSMGLPEGSSSRICLPPLPPTISLRKCACVSRNASTSLGRSSTSSWMRFQPPGSGLRPSGVGWPAPPEPGSLSRRRRSPRQRTAKPGGVKLYTEAEPLGVERDCRLDVMDYVTHADRGHLWSSSDLVVVCYPHGGTEKGWVHRAKARFLPVPSCGFCVEIGILRTSR